MKSKLQKQEEAAERQKAYDKLTTAEKLATLPSKATGTARRQRARLEASLKAERGEKADR